MSTQDGKQNPGQDQSDQDAHVLEITPHIIRALDAWQLEDSEIIAVLGLTGAIKTRELRKYRNKTQGLPWSQDMARRVDHIGGITEALQNAYPFSPEFRAMWLRQPHRRFRRATPLKVILDEGVAGLEKVRVEVDCAYGWEMLNGQS